MEFFTIFFVAIGLAMDAFAVSISVGTISGEKRGKYAFLAGLTFGGFQMLMPIIGWALGYFFVSKFKAFDHWVAFFILFYIGAKMLWDGLKKKDCSKILNIENPKILFLLALATSMDALVVGLSFSLLQIPIVLAIIVIGIVTFLFSYYGVYLGEKLCCVVGNKAYIAGGIMLILIAFKILIEHIAEH